MYKKKKQINNPEIKNIFNLGVFNKFFKGVKITKINPTKLLIKNWG